MSTFKKDLVVLSRYISNLHGGSQPILAEASDGLLYVVKFSNNPQGANLPFNESAGSELYHSFGLACAAWTPLFVTDSFLDQNRQCWIQTPEGSLRPATGLCFGSRFLGGGGAGLLEILPASSFKRITNQMSFWLAWMVDICAQHTDNRQAIFRENARRGLKAFFVDHGSLFGGPEGGQQKKFLASRYLDPRIYPSVSSEEILKLHEAARCLDGDTLWKRIGELPDEWKTTSTLEAFAQCVDRLSNAKLLENVVDTMVDAHCRGNGDEQFEYQRGREPPTAVLRIGVQTAELQRNIPWVRVGHRACA